MRILGREGNGYRIVGTNIEALEIDISREGPPVFCEPGGVISSRGLTIKTAADTKRRSGISGKVLSMGKRLLAGEGAFLLTFEGDGSVIVSGKTPGRVVPVKLDGETVLGQRDAFLAAVGEIDVSAAFQKKISAALFGGTGLIIQKVSGTGIAFFYAGGDYVRFDLEPGEELLVDPGCAFLWDASVSYDVITIKDLKTVVFGGEGLFFAKLTGPGKVVAQTAPVSRLRAALSTEERRSV